jgi:hypothetical protein
MKQRLRRCLLTLAAFMLVFNPSALGWGDHGHTISGRAAAMKLPSGMPKFFRKSVDQLSYLNPEPDRWRDRAESNIYPAMNAAFAPDHYVDLEFVPAGGLDAPDRYAFISELVKAGRKPNEAGFLPYHALELFQRLRAEFRLWRAEKDSKRRGWIEERIINDAGLLGHYVADGANPHHTTMHHNGWVGENPKGYTTERDFHGRFENEYVRTHIQLSDLLPLVGDDARVLDNPREAIIAHLRDSHAKVEELYELEKREKFGAATAGAEHKKFAAARLAAGARMLRDLWWTAWVTSAATGQATTAGLSK